MAKSTLPPELLAQPARRIARRVARPLLLKVLEEAARLEIRSGEPPPSGLSGAPVVVDPDPEAVHDFRVALRRLRTWLQAFRPFLEDTVTRSGERRLRRLSRLAGEARDLQVQSTLIRQLFEGIGPIVAGEARRLERRLLREEFRARQRLIRSVVKDLPGSAAVLSAQLQEPVLKSGRGGKGAPLAMAAALAQIVARRRDSVELCLSRMKRDTGNQQVHAARIAMKRLRYLLEPLGASSRLAARAVGRLNGLQDGFGRFHDAQVLVERLSRRRLGPLLRARLQQHLQTCYRDVLRLSRSRDVTVARQATVRLVRRLERLTPAR